jgi:hypothetical protein
LGTCFSLNRFGAAIPFPLISVFFLRLSVDHALFLVIYILLPVFFLLLGGVFCIPAVCGRAFQEKWDRNKRGDPLLGGDIKI